MIIISGGKNPIEEILDIEMKEINMGHIERHTGRKALGMLDRIENIEMAITELEAIPIIDTVGGVEEEDITVEIETTEMSSIRELIEVECKDTIVMIDRIMETETHILHPKISILIVIRIEIVQIIQYEIPEEYKKMAK